MKKKCIYSLSYWDFTAPLSKDEGPEDVVFYIGKTSDPDKRLIAHRSKAKTGHEDVYSFIRDLEVKKIPWELNVLHEIESGDNKPWEYMYVIYAVREGAPLKNMRYGDYNESTLNLLKTMSEDKNIKTVEDIEKVLKSKSTTFENDYKKSEKLQLRATIKSLRWLREEHFQSQKWNVYDQGEGTPEIRAEWSMKKVEVAQLITPKAKNEFKNLQKILPTYN